MGKSRLKILGTVIVWLLMSYATAYAEEIGVEGPYKVSIKGHFRNLVFQKSNIKLENFIRRNFANFECSDKEDIVVNKLDSPQSGVNILQKFTKEYGEPANEPKFPYKHFYLLLNNGHYYSFYVQASEYENIPSYSTADQEDAQSKFSCVVYSLLCLDKEVAEAKTAASK